MVTTWLEIPGAAGFQQGRCELRLLGDGHLGVAPVLDDGRGRLGDKAGEYERVR